MKTIVRYKYLYASGAGPYYGKVAWDGKERFTRCEAPKKGDEIYMYFGLAVVTSVKRQK